MGNVVEFKSRKDKTELKFDEFIEGSPYLKLTCINALSGMGYLPTIDGAKEFQQDSNLEPTGIIGYEELGILMQIFEPDKFQDILNHIDERSMEMEKMNKDDNKKVNPWLIVIWLIIFAFFEIVGFMQCFTWVCNFIENLF